MPDRRSERPTNVESAWLAMKQEAASCTRCELYRCATQTVFGEGELNAAILFVGEQPGDREDLDGHPFVGPAGQLLDRALEEAGIDRDRTYVTNAVKHFKFKMRGKRRLHSKPDSGEIRACQLADGGECWVTVHPSALLRARGEDERREGRKAFVADLRRIRKRAEELAA